MIDVQTQAEFEALLFATPTNQAIRLFPCATGGDYLLPTEWRIPSGAFITGIHRPSIRYTGTVPAATTRAMLRTAPDAERVRLRGVELIGSPVAGWLTGIIAEDAGRSKASGRTSGTTSRYEPGTVGIQSTAPGVTIEDCLVRGMEVGLDLGRTHNFRLSRNTLRDIESDGIRVRDSRVGIISGNRVGQTGRDGLSVTNSSSLTITGNRTGPAGRDGIRISTDSTLITLHGNQASDATAAGLNIRTSSFISASGNACRNNGGAGLLLTDALGLGIAANLCTGNGGPGINGTVTRSTLSGNLARSNAAGITLDGNHNLLNGNVLTGNTGRGLELSATHSRGTGNHLHANGTDLVVTGSGSAISPDVNRT